MKSKKAFSGMSLLFTLAFGGLSIAVANPALTVGTWVNVGPSQVSFGNNVFTQGMAVDPANPNVLYLCVSAFDVSQAGLFKTTDGGSHWTRSGHMDAPIYTGEDTLNEPIRVRIDPKNSNHLYTANGVRGIDGFYRSTDGGNTWSMPSSFSTWSQTTGCLDVYDVAVDPTDFNHLLLSFHNPWRTGDAGIVESKDGGDTWITHNAPAGGGWYAGMSISFLYVPSQGIGNSQTWLAGTQGAGFWRTADGGNNWTKVNAACIQHGGGTMYYTKAGVLYASGSASNMRSTDNGVTWTAIGPGGAGYNCIFGDGARLYTMKCFGPASFITSPETDGNTWTNFNSQQFVQGPFEMALDPVNGILYTASWNAGMWALKLPATAVNGGALHSGKSTEGAQVDSRLFKTIVHGPHGLFTAPNRAELYDVKGRLAHTVTAHVPQVVIVKVK